MIPVTCAADAKRLVAAIKKYKESKEDLLKNITSLALQEVSKGYYSTDNPDDNLDEVSETLRLLGFDVKRIDVEGKESLIISWE